MFDAADPRCQNHGETSVLVVTPPSGSMLALFLAIALLGTDSAFGRSIIDLTGANHDNTDLGGSELYAKAGAYDYGDDDPIDLTAAKVNNPDLTGLEITAESSIGLDPSRPSPSAKPASPCGGHYPSCDTIIASHQSAPLTRRRRLVDNVFTSTADLRTAAQEYNANKQTAIAKYGPIADWNVSTITDMSSLFDNLQDFDAEISSWETSKVTTMRDMFQVRPPLGSHLAPHRTVCPSFDSADRVGV